MRNRVELSLPTAMIAHLAPCGSMLRDLASKRESGIFKVIPDTPQRGDIQRSNCMSNVRQLKSTEISLCMHEPSLHYHIGNTQLHAHIFIH
jgi:hypothetical protein